MIMLSALFRGEMPAKWDGSSSHLGKQNVPCIKALCLVLLLKCYSISVFVWLACYSILKQLERAMGLIEVIRLHQVSSLPVVVCLP